MSLTSYKNWLEREGYCASTVRESVRRLGPKSLGDTPERRGIIPRYMWSYLSRYLRFVVETKKEPLGAFFTKRLQAYGLQPAKKRQLSGKRKRKQFSDEDFKKLRAHLRTQKDAASRLLLAYMFTDKRIGSFLCLTAGEILSDVYLNPINLECLVHNNTVRDKISRDWLRTLDMNYVYEILSENARGAYVRLRYKLAQESNALGLTVDLDTLHQYALERRGVR
jgi:hypothetical protein